MMPHQAFGRGLPRLAESTTSAGCNVPERLQAILHRVEGQTGDIPVAVSAAFLRSVADYIDSIAAVTAPNSVIAGDMPAADHRSA
jgi:hypothetical protein